MIISNDRTFINKIRKLKAFGIDTDIKKKITWNVQCEKTGL